MHRTIHHLGLALAAGSLLAAAAPVDAQNCPERPVRFIVSYAPGGPTDIWFRMIAKRLSEKCNQPFLVDNKPGAGGVIGTTEVAKAAPDGYTLGFGGLVFFSPIFHNNLTYDVRRDFQLLGGLYKTGFVLAVPSSIPVKTVAEFISYVKASPGKFNYSAGTNSGELMMEIPKATVVTRGTVFTRAGVSADIVNKLNAAIREGTRNPEFADRLKLEDAEAYNPTVADLKNVVEEDIAFWAEAARVANYKP